MDWWMDGWAGGWVEEKGKENENKEKEDEKEKGNEQQENRNEQRKLPTAYPDIASFAHKVCMQSGRGRVRAVGGRGG